MNCRVFTLWLAMLCFACPCSANGPGEDAFLQLSGREKDGAVIPLWPGDGIAPLAPRATLQEEVENRDSENLRITNVSRPSMIVLPPPAGVQATGVTILFAPGGGYGRLSLPNAVDISRWAGVIGAHCVVLKYSVPRIPDDPSHRVPLADAQRAIRLLRAKADELKIDADKIVMVGSSAGGHLTFNVANNHGATTYSALDEADRLSARPDAVVLMYPAYLTQPTQSLTSNPDLHLDKLTPTRTPPVFITVTRPDKFNWGALQTMLRLRQAKVPSELHVYPEGGHGGCFNKYPLMEFVRPAARFLEDQGLFTAAMRRATGEWLDDLEATFLDRSKHAAPPSKPLSVTAALPETAWSPADRKLASLGPQSPTIIRLWPGDGTRAEDPLSHAEETLPEKDDGLVRVTDVSCPTLHHWQPAAPDGRAVIVFPGGAYNILAAQHEGTEIARWLNRQGITAFLTKYRVPRREGMAKHAVALQDAQRAIRTVRSRAAEFGIKPDQIGVLGFSAGGNLATLTVHQAETRSYEAVDDIDQASARPDFAVLIYPAYLRAGGDGAALDPLFAPLQSQNDYPPVFCAVAADDRFAPDSIHYALHLHQQKIAGELHVYASGGHGKGLRETGGPFAQWTQSCGRWLADLKYGTTNINVDKFQEHGSSRGEPQR